MSTKPNIKSYCYGPEGYMLCQIPLTISTLQGPVEGINVPLSNYINTYGNTSIENPYHRTPDTCLADDPTIIRKCGPNVAGVLDPLAQKLCCLYPSMQDNYGGISLAGLIIGAGIIYVIAKKM